MNSIEVLNLLDSLNIKYNKKNDNISSIERSNIINKLMNVSLQCLGAIRLLAIEDESIDNNDNHTNNRLVRQIYCNSVKLFVKSILLSNNNDDNIISNIFNSFPNKLTYKSTQWLLLPLSIYILSVKYIHNEDLLHKYMKDIKYLLANNNNYLNEYDSKGFHYLYYSISIDSIELTNLFVILDENILTRIDINGKSPLHYIAMAGKSNAIILLRLFLPYYKPSIEFFCGSMCLDHYNNSPLHDICRYNSNISLLKELSYLFSYFINRPNDYGYIPLHLACIYNSNDLSFIETIYQAKVTTISSPDNTGKLCIHLLCIYSKSFEVIRLIYQCYPSSVSIPDSKSQRLPIHYAVASCLNFDIIEYLISLNPTSICSYDKYRRIPIHYLITRNSYILKSNNKNDVNYQNVYKSLIFLLDNCPDSVGMRGYDGKSLYDLARRESLPDDIIYLILTYDKDVDYKNFIRLHNKLYPNDLINSASGSYVNSNDSYTNESNQLDESVYSDIQSDDDENS